MSLFENHAGVMDKHSSAHNQQPISEKFVFVLIMRRGFRRIQYLKKLTRLFVLIKL